MRIVIVSLGLTAGLARESQSSEERSYVPASWLTAKENTILKSATTTIGSFVCLRFIASLGGEGQQVGMNLLALALRRYSQATLFTVSYGAQELSQPYLEDRWTYNRKKQTLILDAREESNPWAHQASVYQVTDAVLLDTAGAQKGLGDVIYYGATTKVLDSPLKPSM